MLNIHRILLALLLPTAASIGLAQTLISWDVSGIEADTLTAPYTVAGTNLATGISGGSLSLGSGTNPTTSAAQYGFKISSSNAQTTLAGAISQNHYMQWTVTADSGFNFTVTSLDILGQSSGTGADNVALFSSVEGFTDGDQIKEVSSIQDVTGGFDSDASGFGSVTFTGMAAYQNISSITFRIYGWNTSNSSSAGTTRIRNLGELDPDLLVLGTATAVPEPFSFAALAGLATIGFAASRRRVRTTMA
jgi:hypothetical protein